MCAAPKDTVFSRFGHSLGIDFAHFGHKLTQLNMVYGFLFYSSTGYVFRRSYFFIISDKTMNKSPTKIMLRATVSAAAVIKRISNFWSGYTRKFADFGYKWGNSFGKRAAHPHQVFCEYPSG